LLERKRSPDVEKNQRGGERMKGKKKISLSKGRNQLQIFMREKGSARPSFRSSPSGGYVEEKLVKEIELNGTRTPFLGEK